ncbi:MAG: DNA mismatch repair protein MutS [bacterium]|nr:DNA mismatch repair protein MutS [bacterium]
MSENKKRTPLMQQYFDIKDSHKDSILFFRLGDFYEMFEEDALIASEILNITLTKRHTTPMCGIPYHSSSAYLLKLLKAGKKIAICEQLTEPQKGVKIVERDVVRVITPGTVLEENFLNEHSNNFLVAIIPHKKKRCFALAAIDVSTAELRATYLTGKNMESDLKAEIWKYSPIEIIIPGSILNNKEFMRTLEDTEATISIINQIDLNKKLLVNKHSNTEPATTALMSYLSKNYKALLPLIKDIIIYETKNFLHLPENTLKHLEIIENFYSKERKFSLLDILDKTKTPMGARLLKQWLIEPLIKLENIQERQNLVEFFHLNKNLTKQMCEIFHHINDIERTITRIHCDINIPRDIIAIKNVLGMIPDIKKTFTGLSAIPKIIFKLFSPLDDEILSVIENKIETCLIENPANNLKDGNIIKDGFNEELDRLRALKSKGRAVMCDYESQEKNRSEIATLRIKFNNVFGYFLEVSKSYKDKVPDDYIPIQTLTNVERFTTEQLKKYEVEILEAEQKSLILEQKIYNDLRDFINLQYQALKKFTNIVALVDVYTNLAFLAGNNNYIKPEINDSYNFKIIGGRHPVVERIFSESDFVSNDTDFSENGTHLYLITGPNMAGKSTYIRQVALISIMAQIGSFVPADSAKLGIVDKIFTRIGSGDRLIKGESTFMVEMKETVEILKESTSNSLVILDEVGRGTSTFDGISLAWIIALELGNRQWRKDQLGPKTLFATHYLELTELENILPGIIKNYSLAVDDSQGEVIFLHKIIVGTGDKSYGIHVAKMAGMPLPLIQKSQRKLRELENMTKQETQFSFFSSKNTILDELKSTDLDALSPVDALLKLKEWQELFL